nr:Tn3 family transposase [Hymenobacter coccineus]
MATRRSYSTLQAALAFLAEKLHSSGDEQKQDLAVDSLGGSASFNYCGNRCGLTAHSYVDETLLVFDSTVSSAADCEATHLLEGLLRHAVRPTDVHSTATRKSSLL